MALRGDIFRLFLQWCCGFSCKDIAFPMSIMEREHLAEAACQQASLLSGLNLVEEAVVRRPILVFRAEQQQVLWHRSKAADLKRAAKPAD